MKKQQSGFTLIELMIVVAIIGILASVSIPMYRDYIVRTKVATALTTVSNIKTALTITNNEGGSWVAMTEAAADLPKWQNIGMRLPDVSVMPEITGIAVDDAGKITIKLAADITGVADSTIVLTPSFNGAVTTWSSKFNKGSLTDVDTEALIKTYLERNANGS